MKNILTRRANVTKTPSSKRSLTLIFIVAATLLLVSACGRNHEGDTRYAALTLEDVLAIAQYRREGVIRPGDERLAGLTEGRPRQTVNVAALLVPVEQAEIISSADAIYDIVLFFNLLREVYGAYFYFGGDEVFFPIRDQIIDTLSTQDYWEYHGFIYMLYRALAPVINDSHFRLDVWAMGNTYHFFQDISIVPFGRSENGFYKKETGLYVEEIISEGQSLVLDEIFRLSLNNLGEFYYSPVIMLPFAVNSPLTIMITVVYANGEEGGLRLTRIPATMMAQQPASLEYHDGIPVVNLGMLMGNPFAMGEGFWADAHEDALRFISFAYELQDEPVIIVDIRSNLGGFPQPGFMWLYQIIGEVIPINSIGVSVQDVDMLTWPDMDEEHFLYIPYDITVKYLGYEQLDELHVVAGIIPERIVPNNQLLIFLTDRWTASAGEMFADAAFNIENTLIIGQNTMGALFNNVNYMELYLPNSGLSFGLGRTTFINPEGHLPEGIGIAPDIWVTGDALAAALTMLDKHFQVE